MKKYKILAVEDEATMQVLLQRCLGLKYDLVITANLERAKQTLEHFKPDLVLLDIYLPDGNGFDFFDFLKQDLNTQLIPVIFLTLETGTQMKVKSFSAGAYDYVTKPFDHSELIARIDAHCARSTEIISAHYSPDTFDTLFFNREARQVYRQEKNGNKQFLSLSPMEFKLLECFMTHLGKTLSRDQIAKEVWNRSHFQSRTIDRHISSLRKKLGATGSYLKTVSQGGYLLSLESEAEGKK